MKNNGEVGGGVQRRGCAEAGLWNAVVWLRKSHFLKGWRALASAAPLSASGLWDGRRGAGLGGVRGVRGPRVAGCGIGRDWGGLDGGDGINKKAVLF